MSRDEGDLPRTVATLMCTVPRLGLGLGTTYLRMRVEAKRAGREFYRELVGAGMPKEAARQLTDEYVSTLSLGRLLKETGVRDMLDPSSR